MFLTDGSVCSRCTWNATASAFTLYVECYGQCVHAVRGMLRPVRSRYTWNATVQCVNAERGMLRPVCSRCTWNATASAFTLYVECYGQCVHAVREMLWVSVFMSYDRGMLGSNAVGGVLQSRMSIQIAVAFAYTHRVY